MEWSRYTEPSDEPDASVEKDMNTFIALTKETEVDDWKPTLALIKRVEVIALAVENVWSECLATRNSVGRSKALGHLITLRDIILEKLDIATVKLLAFSDELQNDRQEINVENTGHRLNVGLWASFADVRPIRKSVIFESIGIQIDLQKQLLQQHDNFVFRVTRMPIVTYNLEAYDISPEVVADIMATKLPSPSVTATAAADSAGAPLDGQDGERGEENEASRTGSQVASPKVSPRPGSETSVKLPSKYVVGDLFLFDILYAPAPAFHLRARKWTMRNKAASATKLRKSAYPSSVPSRVQLKVPEDVLMTDDMRVAVWNEEQKEWVEDSISDYQYNETTRTVQFYITTVGILALVKKRVEDLPYRKWTLAPVLAKPINAMIAAKLRVTDPSELDTPKLPKVASTNASSTEPSDEGKSGEMDKVGGDSVVSDAASADRNAAVKIPATDPVDSRTASASHLFEQYARLTINTQKLEIVIDVAGSMCILVKPVTPIFADILNVPMNPGTLLRRLQRKGVNILPNAVDLAVADRVSTKVCSIYSSLILYIFFNFFF